MAVAWIAMGGVCMQRDSRLAHLGDSEWLGFMANLEAAEHEFAQGRPAAIK
jgi:hypothetical protein